MERILTDGQAVLLRRSRDGVRFAELNEEEQEILLWLMAKPREYCAANVQRHYDAIFATQEGQCALATYDHTKKMEKLSPLFQIALVILGAVLSEAVRFAVTLL